MSRKQPFTLMALGVMFVIAAGLTCAAYFSFIIPDYRGGAFYAGVFGSCIAEMVFFGYLGYAVGAVSSPDQPDSAVRMRLMTPIGVWMLAILVTGGIAAAPGNADTFFSDKIILIQLIVTFLVFGAVFFQHRQTTAVQTRDAAPQQDRRQLESYAGGLNALLDNVRALGSSHPDHAVALDALAKRIDTIKTQLRSASASTTREASRPANPADIALIEQRLVELHDAAENLAAAGEDGLGEQIPKTRSAADRALATLRQREDAMTF